MCKSRTSFNNNRIAQRRLRPCNLHSPLSLRINAIVDDHIAVAVALVFAKLSIAGAAGGQQVALFCQNCTSKFVHFSQELEFGTIFKQCLKVRYSPYVNKGFVYISVSKI